MRAGVERDDAFLYHLGVVQLALRVGELHGESQWALVENLIALVARRHQQVAVGLHERIGSTAQCGAYGVAIHALSVVDVVAIGVVNLVGKVLVATLPKVLNHAAHVLVLLAGVPIVEHQVAGVLVEQVVAHRSAVTVDAVSHLVVLPSKLVLSLGEEAAGHLRRVFLGCSLCGVVHGLALGGHASLENELAVVGGLRGNFLAVGVGNDDVGGGIELALHVGELRLHHLRAGRRQGVGKRNGYFVGRIGQGAERRKNRQGD